MDVAVDCFEFFAVDLSVEYPPAERYGNASKWLNFIEATPTFMAGLRNAFKQTT